MTSVVATRSQEQCRRGDMYIALCCNARVPGVNPPGRSGDGVRVRDMCIATRMGNAKVLKSVGLP